MQSYLDQEVKHTCMQGFGEGVPCVTRLLHVQRQEIKHEMKTSSSLNILPSHFPISPLPLADLKGRREERDMERGFGCGGERGAELQQRGGSTTKRLIEEECG